jgi:hypothetical protein
MTANLISPSDQKSLLLANSRHFQSSSKEQGDPTEQVDANLEEHLSAKVVHITSNIWPPSGNGKRLRKKASRQFSHGVEIRTLPQGHILAGQKGLFAANPFQQFDIVGEYCGKVATTGGEYVAHLESPLLKDPLGVDAQTHGNELRAINHFQSIADTPNVIMKLCYVEQLPRIMIICKRDIPVGDEFLLNYGDDYFEAYLTGKKTVPVERKIGKAVDWNEMAGYERTGDY